MRAFRQNIVIDGDAYGQLIARVRGLGGTSAHPPKPSTGTPHSTKPGPIPRGGTMADPLSSAAAGSKLGFVSNAAYENTVRVHTREYENAVEEVLKSIQLRGAGRAILRAIVQQIPNLAIVPWLGQGTTDSPNAYTSASNSDAATPKGQPVRDSRGNVLDPSRIGTGRGSDAKIKYLPYRCASEVEGAAELSDTEKPAPGTLADEVLVHELVHALFFMSGNSYGMAVPNQRLYDTQDEFFAILIANVYRSECGRKESRLHHYGYQSDDIRSGEFLRTWENRYIVRKIRLDMPSLFSDLHRVKAKFNPFRRMLNV